MRLRSLCLLALLSSSATVHGQQQCYSRNCPTGYGGTSQAGQQLLIQAPRMQAAAAPSPQPVQATAHVNDEAPAGVKEEWVYFPAEGYWGYGWPLQEGPDQGKYRVRWTWLGAPPQPIPQPMNASATKATAPQAAVPSTDPYGFTNVLNSIRAQYGLPPVGYDANLSAFASQNNAAQCSYGLGHHVRAGAYQNSGWNYSDAVSIAHAWMNSPGHRAAMLAPMAAVGIAHGPGSFWTMNGN